MGRIFGRGFDSRQVHENAAKAAFFSCYGKSNRLEKTKDYRKNHGWYPYITGLIVTVL